MTLRTSSTSRSWQSELLSAVLLILGGIFFALAVAEGILRLVPGLVSAELQQIIERDPDNFGIPNQYIGYLGKPNFTYITAGKDFRAVSHTDGYGFRNAWPWPDRAEIVAVGDSLTNGYGVENDQEWPAILKKKLPGNRLVNLGLTGAGPQQYFRLYETFGIKLHPKLLLVGFLVRNDFWDDQMFDLWLKSGSGGNYMVWRDFGRPKFTRFDPEQPIASLSSSLRWRVNLLASKSRVYNLLHYSQGNIRGWLRAGSKNTESTRTFETPDGTPQELALRDYANVTKHAQPGSRAFEISVEALRRLHAIAGANGTRALVVFQPSKEETYLPLMGITDYDSDPGRPLRVRLEKLGIPYVDLLPEFRSRAAKGEVLFFEIDGHPNARGYALIAELVLDHIKRNAKTYDLN